MREQPSSHPCPIAEQVTAGSESRPQLESQSTELKHSDMGRSLGQITIVLIVLLVLVNIPFSYAGTGLAHIIPAAATVLIYDGLLLRNSNGDTYLMEEHKLRRISSLEAFNDYFSSATVRNVDDRLLEQFSQGQPIRRLIKCQSVSHIYALENGKKRLVQDLPVTNQTRPWDNVHLVSCDYLRSLPTGSPIVRDSEP